MIESGTPESTTSAAPIAPDPLIELTGALQLASAVLPVGHFSYSQGLEAAVESGLVRDLASAEEWVCYGLMHLLATCDLPILRLTQEAWQATEETILCQWNTWYLASRETAELRSETEQMGWSLAQLMAALEQGEPAQRSLLAELRPIAYPVAFAYASLARNLSPPVSQAAYAYAWLEAQTMAALRTIPLGQVAGQQLLSKSCRLLPSCLALAQSTGPPSSFAPHCAILSARHEHQYSRLFRS